MTTEAELAEGSSMRQSPLGRAGQDLENALRASYGLALGAVWVVIIGLGVAIWVQ